MTTLSWLRPTAFHNELVPSELALKLIEQLGLDVSTIMLLMRSGSHNCNPYHNTLHELQHAYWSNACFVNAAASLKENLFVKRAECSLLLASLFHDHNHSGGRHSDRVNIDRAIRFVETNFREDESLESLITTTEFFNGTFTHPPTNLLEHCMRDADLMSIYTREGRRLLWGLIEEINNKRMKDMTEQEITNALKRNRDFLKSAEMYTEFGRVMKSDHLDTCLIEFEEATKSQYRYRKDMARGEDE